VPGRNAERLDDDINSGQRALHRGDLEGVAGHFFELGVVKTNSRADRASARTECPASSAAFTVSRPIPLLAPMIRTVATASCSMLPVGSAWLTVMCDAGSDTRRIARGLRLSPSSYLRWTTTSGAGS
jgi:hypothetical protein